MSSAFDWAPGGCCCGVPYEAWARLNSDQFAIHNFVRLFGENTDSIDDFAPDDEYNGDEYGVGMEVLGYVYLAENDSSDTECSVARYDATTGDLEWEQTASIDYSPSGFRLSGDDITAARMSINSTQAFVGNGVGGSPAYTLFESTGTTGYSAAPNTTSDPYYGDSADWIPTIRASHDYPIVAGHRTYIDNFSASYVDTDNLGGGNYRHNFTIDYDVVFEVGYGTFNPSTGAMSSVSVADTLSVSYTGVSDSITNMNPTPPTPGASDFTLSTNNYTFNTSRTYYPIEVFHSLVGGTDYILGYTVKEEDSGGSFSYIQKFIINDNEAESWSDSSSYLVQILSGAIVHEQPAVHSAAVLSYQTVSTGDETAGGYDLSGNKDWSEDFSSGATWYSVNDTWGLLAATVSGSTMMPDGRTWTAGFSWWMVRLDNGVWEPCRQPFGGSAYVNNSYLTGMSATSGNGSNVDLLKTVQHPYGPPDSTYDTTAI